MNFDIFRSRYNLWTRWGRVGEPGQNSLGPTGDLEAVKKEFKKKFTDKTKNKWESRDSFEPVPGKYTLLEMDDESEVDEEEVKGHLAECWVTILKPWQGFCIILLPIISDYQV